MKTPIFWHFILFQTATHKKLFIVIYGYDSMQKRKASLVIVIAPGNKISKAMQ